MQKSSHASSKTGKRKSQVTPCACSDCEGKFQVVNRVAECIQVDVDWSLFARATGTTVRRCIPLDSLLPGVW